jgi:AcrR family transcriptional regulator
VEVEGHVNAKRRYVSPRREQSAADTRRRIVAAAHELFVAQGYGSTSVGHIARHAGVAVKTVYLDFPGKPALLDAAIGNALGGDDTPIPLRDRDWFRAVQRAPADELLDLFAAQTVAIMERAAAIMQVAEAAGDADPAVRERRDMARQARWSDMRRIAAALAEEVSDLDADEVADSFYALASTHNYLALVSERGWSADRYVSWLARGLRAALSYPQ